MWRVNSYHSGHAASRPFADRIRRCPQLFICGFNSSRAPLHASTSSSCARSGETLEDTEQLLVPRPAQDLHIARPALRAERPEARELVAALRGRQRGEAAERDHEVERLALAGLPRILAEADPNPVFSCVSVLSSNRSTSAGVGAGAHNIQQPVAAALIAATLDPNRPIRSGSAFWNSGHSSQRSRYAFNADRNLVCPVLSQVIREQSSAKNRYGRKMGFARSRCSTGR